MAITIGGGTSSNKRRDTVAMAGPSGAEQEAQNLQLAALRGGAASPVDQQLEGLATQQLLDRMSGKAPIISPEQQAQLDQIYGYQQQQGLLALKQAAQDAAASRGMGISDSPIGNEYLRQVANFQGNMGAQKAQAALDMGSALAQFQNQLRQQALTNRLNYAQTAGGMGQNLFGQRYAGAARTTTGGGTQFSAGTGGGGLNLGNVATAVGNLPWNRIGSGVSNVWNSIFSRPSSALGTGDMSGSYALGGAPYENWGNM